MSNKVQIVKQPLYGSVYWNGVKFIYTPKPGFVGKDSYIYTVSNGLTSQTLTNYVDTINQAPSANNIVLPNVDINQISLIDITNYVTDYDKLVNPVSIKSITQPSQGKAYITNGTTISYQSNGYNAVDSFTYTITDGQYDRTATITLTSINGQSSTTVDQGIVDTVNMILDEVSLVLSNTANWNDAYNIVSTSSARWNSNDPTQFLEVFSTVSANSAKWESSFFNKHLYDMAYSTITANSGNWDGIQTGLVSLSTLIFTNSANWKSTFTTVSSHSADWETASSVVTAIQISYTLSAASWTDAMNLIQSQSATWNSRGTNTTLQYNSGNWNTVLSIVSSNSALWELGANNANSFMTTYSADSALWESSFNIVQNTSASWGATTSVEFTILTAYSGMWNNAYSIVSGNSAAWSALSSKYLKYDQAYAALTGTSGNWEAAYSGLSVLSSEYLSIINLVSTNSAAWLTGGPTTDLEVRNLTVRNNLIIYGNLTAQGTGNVISTQVVDTSAYHIVNTGLTDALKVTKTQNQGALGRFEINNNPVLYISTSGTVGINTDKPTEALTVVGNISASGFLYGKTPSLYTNFQDNSAKYNTTSTYVLNNSAAIAGMILSATNYLATLTYLTGASAGINALVARKPVYDTYYNNLIAQYPLNAASYSFISANSATMGGVIDSVFRSRYADYEDAYTYYTTATGNTIAQINFIFDGSGDIVPVDAYGVVQIPCNVRILEWAIYSNVASTTQVEVAVSNYANYPTFQVISQSDILATDCPQLSSVIKNTANTLPGWTTQVNAGDLLKFRVVQNSNSSFFTVALKCRKI